jgi:hypothetical protein
MPHIPMQKSYVEKTRGSPKAKSGKGYIQDWTEMISHDLFNLSQAAETVRRSLPNDPVLNKIDRIKELADHAKHVIEKINELINQT